MKGVFLFAEKGYELALGPSLMRGAAACGDEIVMKPLGEYQGPEFDFGIICGVVKREVLWDHIAKGHPILSLDKGYIRTREMWNDASIPSYWRLCWNAVHPTRYLMAVKRDPERAERMGWKVGWTGVARDRNQGKTIVILGSSEKFHHTCHLPHPTEWAATLVREIRQYSEREIVLRPKPSWANAVPVEGTTFDHGSKSAVADTLKNAHVAITYGSIACVDSVLAGVPVICLGDAVARPISSTMIHDVENPRWASVDDRNQWLANLAYCHWRPSEIHAGLAWATTKEMLRYAK